MEQVGVGILLSYAVSGMASMTSADRLMGKFTTSVDGADAKLNSLGKTLGMVTAGAIAMAGGMAMVNSVMGAVDAAGNYEESAAHLQGLMNVSREGIAQFEADAFRLARTSRFTSTEVMDAFWQVISAGFSGNQALQLMEPSLQAAVMGNMEAADSVKMLAATLHSFNIPVDQAQYALDQLTATVRGSMTQFNEINTSVSMFGGMMYTMGQDLATGMSIYGVIRNTGMEASRAATNVKMLTSRLIDLHTSGVEQWGDISLVDPVTGGFRDLLDVFDDLERAMPPVTDAIAQNIIETDGMTQYVEEALSAQLNLYGRRAIVGAMALRNFQYDHNGQILIGIDALRAFRGEIRNSEGDAQSYYDVLMGTWNEQKRIFDSMKEDLAVQVGMPLLESMKPILEYMVEAIQSIGVFLGEHPEIAKALGQAVLLGGVLLIAAGAIVAIAGLAAFIGKIAGILILVAKFIGIIVLIVGALVTAAMFLVRYWEEISAFFVSIGEWLWSKFGGILTVIGLLLISIGIILYSVFKVFWDVITTYLVPVLAVVLGVVSMIIGAILIALNVIWGVIQTIFAVVEALLTGDWTAFQEKFDSIWSQIGDEIKVLGTLFFDTILQAIVDIANEVSGGFFTRMGQAAETGADRGVLGGGAGSIGGLWDAAWGADQWMNPDSYASGTTRVTRDQVAVVHEGNEITQRGRGSSGAGTFSVETINFYSYGKEDPEEFANRAYSEFMRRMASEREAVVNV